MAPPELIVSATLEKAKDVARFRVHALRRHHQSFDLAEGPFEALEQLPVSRAERSRPELRAIPQD
jgi:hypothetical protein